MYIYIYILNIYIYQIYIYIKYIYIYIYQKREWERVEHKSWDKPRKTAKLS